MMRQSKYKTVKRTGFTLIEMVVAVAIFAVVASIVFPALVEFLDVRERIDQKHEEIVGLQKAFLFLAKDLRYASNRLGKDEYGDEGKVTLSIGDDSLVELTAMYPDLNLDGLNVPRRVRWALEKGVLERIQYPVMDPGNDTRILRQKLITDVEDVEVEVSSVEDGRDNTSKKWDEQTRLPDLISVKVTLKSGVEYRRVFTMLGGDNRDAIVAAGGGPAGGNGPGGRGSSGDESFDGGTGGGGSTSSTDPRTIPRDSIDTGRTSIPDDEL